MDTTLICASKREHLQRGSHIYTVEFTNTENLQNGILDATLHIETSDPEFADRFALNESYSIQLPD